MAPTHASLFDPLSAAGIGGDGGFQVDVEALKEAFPGEWKPVEEFFGEGGRLNVTERLAYLFRILDRAPIDGGLSYRELEMWNVRQAFDRLIHRTEARMMAHDADGDGAVTLREFLSNLSDQELESNNTAHGKPGWWREQFVNVDADGNGSLNHAEFSDFLHPEDSTNAKVQLWLQKEKIKEMDEDRDGKLSFNEFKNRVYDIYKNYAEFESAEEDESQHKLNAEQKFEELDVDKDRFLTAEELKPIIHNLHPGEISYAKYYTKYLMHEADENKDGKLTLLEMLEHQYAFYSAVVEDSNSDDNDDDDYWHDELR
ncbi:Calcium-dependent protein kinase 28 [Acorus calamus]|uniref:Calcium-dependent protein kinase 28 n=1 Tax=Acorus calamus TaxID=4465 RepID=A0AAV9C1V4_ACOCL|nr:Calcium-dependent protein kinase 28 [Acorus calamus]